ncbi:Uncharacterised protein g10786 [Pycnogonum litorale]
MSGQEQKCKGVGNVQLQSGEIGPVNVDVFVADIQPLGFDFILGMTGIQALGGVQITPTRTVSFGSTQKHTCSAAAAMSIEEKDFDASYDHKRKKWTVAWKWSGNDQPDPLKNKIAEYAIPIHVKREYDMEITSWIENGWLQTYDEKRHGPVKGIIPLMAVIQKNKAKVRPVMDFRELNSHVEAYTASADVCADKLRKWRRQGTNVAIVDLRKAYLQIHVHESLWPFQTVKFRGQRYLSHQVRLRTECGSHHNAINAG